MEIIFSRFGKINCCEIIRDRRTNASLQYAFIEFEEVNTFCFNGVCVSINIRMYVKAVVDDTSSSSSVYIRDFCNFLHSFMLGKGLGNIYACVLTFLDLLLAVHSLVVSLCFQVKSCENAYFKMDNVLIDDRRIHVDFSQSVAKNYQWKRKGILSSVRENRRLLFIRWVCTA